MLKAKENSSASNKSSPEDTRELIIAALRVNKNSTPDQIRDYIENEFNKSLSAYRIKNLLNSLKDMNKAEIETTKSTYLWNLVDDSKE